MTTLERSSGDLYPPEAPPPRRRGWLALAIAALAALVGIALVVVANDDDGSIGAPSTTTAPSTETTSTTPPASTTLLPSTGTDLAVFPDPASGATYGDPVDVARAFAADLLGFVDPVVGEYMAGDSRSGEVEVRPAADGPATTVFVRQLTSSDDWYVLGSATGNIRVSEPDALATISSPVRLRGVSTAFEANVTVEIRQDGSDAPIGLGWVMGGSNGEMRPFEGTLAFSVPSAERGVVILSTSSMADGRMWEASVVRVAFATTSTCGGLPAPPLPFPDQTAVSVFFTCGDDVDGATLEVVRTVPRTTGVLRAALEQLLDGPTDAERETGLTSWFSAETAGMLQRVTLSANGDAVVDFADLRPVIPNASASAGSQLLLSQLDATVFQFPTVTSVVYRIDGDCEAFNEWLQLGGCDRRRRP